MYSRYYTATYHSTVLSDLLCMMKTEPSPVHCVRSCSWPNPLGPGLISEALGKQTGPYIHTPQEDGDKEPPPHMEHTRVACSSASGSVLDISIGCFASWRDVLPTNGIPIYYQNCTALRQIRKTPHRELSANPHHSQKSIRLKIVLCLELAMVEESPNSDGFVLRCQRSAVEPERRRQQRKPLSRPHQGSGVPHDDGAGTERPEGS